MDKNVSSVKSIHFTTDQLFLAKDVVLEEFTTPKKINANAKTPLYSSMDLSVLNATIQNTSTLLIRNARFV